MQGNLQHSTFDSPGVQSAGAPDDSVSCTSGQQGFDMKDRPEYSAQEPNFSGENLRYMGQYTEVWLA